MMIAKGFAIGFVCLILGGVIGFKAKYFETGKQFEAMQVGIEIGKKSK